MRAIDANTLKTVDAQPTLQPEPERACVKKYVIEKEGYSTTIVGLTEREALAIENFLDWAEIDDDFFITPVDEYETENWGERSDTCN